MQLSEHLVLFSVTCDCLLFHGGIIKTGESLTDTKVPAKSPNDFYKRLALSGHSGALVPTRLGYRSFFPWQHVLNFK